MDELQPYADYFVGSQKDEPLAGWPYDTFLSAVTAAPLMTPVQAGTWLPSAHVKSYFGTSPYSGALAVVSGAALPSVAGSLAEFVSELNASLPLLQSQVIQARASTERYEKNGLAGGDEFDLYHFSENVAAGTGDPRLASLPRDLPDPIRPPGLAKRAWGSP